MREREREKGSTFQFLSLFVTSRRRERKERERETVCVCKHHHRIYFLCGAFVSQSQLQRHRTSEGGVEDVDLVPLTDSSPLGADDVIDRFKQRNFIVAGTSSMAPNRYAFSSLSLSFSLLSDSLTHNLCVCPCVCVCGCHCRMCCCFYSSCLYEAFHAISTVSACLLTLMVNILED